MKRLEMFQSGDCTWSSDCGHGAHAACATLVAMDTRKTTATEVFVEVPLPGLVGYKFEGPIDVNGNFTVDHESSWVDTYAEGQFDEVNETVNFTIYWHPTGYACEVEIDFEGTPL